MNKGRHWLQQDDQPFVKKKNDSVIVILHHSADPNFSFLHHAVASVGKDS
jgi:hypothetical protein